MLGTKKRTMAVLLAALLAVAAACVVFAGSERASAAQAGIGTDTKYHGWSHTYFTGVGTNHYETFYLQGDSTQQTYLAYCFKPGAENPGVETHIGAGGQVFYDGKGTPNYTSSGPAQLTDAGRKVLWNGYPVDGSGHLATMAGTDAEKRWGTFLALSQAQGTLGNLGGNWLKSTTPASKAVYDWLSGNNGTNPPAGFGGVVYTTTEVATWDWTNRYYQDLIVPTIDVPVTKTWQSDDASKRPSSVAVKLFANGVDTGKSAQLTEANGWSATFDTLAYADKDGNAISYTIQEAPVAG